MRCYYEELCIARNSNDADIKSAYRKLALRWHPDKNPDCLEEATERFQLIQQAYEVLSDAQERAWYDKHREQILRGRNSDYEDRSLDLFQYFTVSCYKGYGDDPNSFYSVYRTVFGTLAAEDMEFMDDRADINTIPNFGKADSNYEEVVGPFYAYWQAYSTKKTYSWLSPYDAKEFKDRYVLRKVEQQVKKISQKARKERNEEVRNLVSFVRKRDRRVQANRRMLEERAELNRQKQEEKRKEQLRKRQEELAAVRQNNSAFNEGYEEQLKQLAQEYGSESENDDSDEEIDSEENSEVDADGDGDDDDDVILEVYIDDLYCVACNKSFRNSNAFANHEESKKHRENTERLCLEMNAEEASFNETVEGSEDCAVANDSLDDAEEVLDELHLNEAQSDEDDKPENISIASNKRNKRGKKSKKFHSTAEDSASIDPSAHDLKTPEKADDSSDADNWSHNKKSGKKTKNRKSTAKNDVKLSKAAPNKIEDPAESLPTVSKLNAPTAAEQSAEAAAPQHICVTCNSSFESKNKLFAHLNKTNHGVYLPKAQPVVKGKPSKAKGKRK